MLKVENRVKEVESLNIKVGTAVFIAIDVFKQIELTISNSKK